MNLAQKFTKAVKKWSSKNHFRKDWRIDWSKYKKNLTAQKAKSVATSTGTVRYPGYVSNCYI